MNRRDLLRALGAAAAAGLAGCNTDGADDTPTANRSPTGGRTATASPTATPGDTTAPSIDAFTAQHTDTAGEVAVSLEGHDENLDTARISTPATDLARSPDGSRVTVDTEMQGDPGRTNDITARLVDAAGNGVEQTVEPYVRKYDRLDETPVDVSAVYIPFAGDKFGRCLSGTDPGVGTYGDPIPPEVTSRHVDQMQGHGITTVAFNFGEDRSDYSRWRTFTESSLSGELNVEAYYVISQALGRDRDVKSDVEFLAQEMVPHDNYNTLDGRPVVQFWGTRVLPWVEWDGMDRDDPYASVSEWESTAEFLDYVRQTLSVGGEEAFLVGEFRNHGVGGVPDVLDEDSIPWEGAYRMTEERRELVGQLDAISSWTGPTYEGKTTQWETAYEVTRLNFEGLRAIADEHDVDFVPTVYPGFNDTHNYCWGPDRHIPRSPDHLRQLFALAAEYRTVEKVNIATFNGWPEGHQIEPGTFNGEDYGTDYMEVVKEYQRGETE